MIDKLNLIKDTNWEEVFQTWKSHEGQDPIWRNFAKEKKGWEDWESWRRFQSSQFNLEKRLWKIFEIDDPNKIIPEFLMGPFRAWQENYPKSQRNVHTFADLVYDHKDWVINNVGIRSRKENFPTNTQFIGIYVKDLEKIVLYEGHHRATAVALRVLEGNPIEFGKNPTIALTVITLDEKKELGELLNVSSEKPQ